MAAKLNRRQSSLILVSLLVGAFSLMMFSHENIENGQAAYAVSQKTRVISSAIAVIDATQADKLVHVPKVQLQGIILHQQHEPSALVAINEETAKWYTRGDEISPGFVITAIDSNQITVRQGDAYYQFR